jgi:hypothetical protein
MQEFSMVQEASPRQEVPRLEASTVEAGTGEQEAGAANRGSSCEGWLRGATEDELAEEFGRRIEFGAIIASCVLLDGVKVERIERGDMDAHIVPERRAPALQWALVLDSWGCEAPGAGDPMERSAGALEVRWSGFALRPRGSL